MGQIYLTLNVPHECQFSLFLLIFSNLFLFLPLPHVLLLRIFSRFKLRVEYLLLMMKYCDLHLLEVFYLGIKVERSLVVDLLELAYLKLK